MENMLPYITAIIASLGFVFSVWKYIDLKNREETRLDYENLNKLIDYVSGDDGFDKDSKRYAIVNSKAIANIYQLCRFKKQSYIVLPFLTYLKEYPPNTDEKSQSKILEAINYTLEKLNQI